MPNSSSVLRATQLRNSSSGCVSFIHSVIAGVSHIAMRSGPAMAMFFGTISPNKMCRNEMMSRASTNATGCSRSPGMPIASNGASM